MVRLRSKAESSLGSTSSPTLIQNLLYDVCSSQEVPRHLLRQLFFKNLLTTFLVQQAKTCYKSLHKLQINTIYIQVQNRQLKETVNLLKVISNSDSQLGDSVPLRNVRLFMLKVQTAKSPTLCLKKYSLTRRGNLRQPNSLVCRRKNAFSKTLKV